MINLMLQKQYNGFFFFQDILRSETKAEAKVRNYVLKHMRGRRDAERTTSLRKWLVMTLKMEGLNASLCHTSWATSLGCPSGLSLSCFLHIKFD